LCLETIGKFDLLQCSSGKESLKKIPKFKPELILLDAMMPEMCGLETLRRLRKLSGFADTPVVFMTAKAHPEEIGAFMEAGAISVIIKPYNPMTLSDKIRSIWETRGGL